MVVGVEMSSRLLRISTHRLASECSAFDLCDGVVDQFEYVVVVIAGHTAEIDGGIGAVRHDIGLHAAVEHP